MAKLVDKVKKCTCIKDKLLGFHGGRNFQTKEGRVYYFYEFDKDTMAIYGKNNTYVYGITKFEFKNHFQVK